MSDPVKSSEIEDVLSSIRRLVSEEARSEMQARRKSPPAKAPAPVAPPMAQTPSAKPAPTVVPATRPVPASGVVQPPKVAPETSDVAAKANSQPEPDALVLTPALRVHQGGADTQTPSDFAVPEAAVSAADLEAEDDAPNAGGQGPEVAQTEAAEAAVDVEAGDDLQEAVLDVVAEAIAASAVDAELSEDPAPMPGNDDVAEPAMDAAPVPDAVGEVAEDEAEVAADPIEDLHEPPSEPLTLDAKLIALEALIATSKATSAAKPEAAAPSTERPIAEITPEPISDVAPMAAPEPKATPEVAPEPKATPEPKAEQEIAPKAQEPVTPEATATVVSLPEDTAEEEPTITWEDHLPEGSDPQADPEPEDLASRDEADPVDVVADAVVDIESHLRPIDPAPMPEAASLAAAEQAPTPSPERTEEANADAGDLQTIDEDTLRTMVAEIVRSELQGALGERITRNVRRLVRREIHRALANQDLD
ncbi:hypothetical protein [Phaeobacter sp. J2-8]|uniref:hypothetical protein n=1 Tax=Phaeobacter sp. J2-8 TaxID=2931394 RepID=UPI001FD247F7|nr:hypothetical protein [Phaeobacter sp. J2-8]MCJ7871502.1 hypothetical protein [Phaeobacter sp. J2-8]